MALHHKIRAKLDARHNAFCLKSPRYAAWHQHPHHQKVHLGILFVYITIISIFIGNQIYDIIKSPLHAASKIYTITQKIDWDAGTNTNLDTNDSLGDAKISPNDSWGVRTWATTPDAITVGGAATFYNGSLYVFRGWGDTAFWKYVPTENRWYKLHDAPYGGYTGTVMAVGPSDTIYALFGNSTKKFYKYTPSTDTWTALTDAQDLVGYGASMAYVNDILYVLRGNGSTDFWYYTEADGWGTLPSGILPTINGGASLVSDGGDYLYTLRGNGAATFYRYSITGRTWMAMGTNYPVNMSEANFAVYYNGTIFITRQSNTTEFYSCTISGTTCSGGWVTKSALPMTARYMGLFYNSVDGYMYVLRGNGGREMWKYNPATDTFIGPAQFPQTITTGGDLIYDGSSGVYGLKGGAAANGFYYYDITANTWTLKTVTGLPALSYDTKATRAGNLLYVPQGNSTNIYTYDMTNDAGGWTALSSVAPGSISNGGGLIYPGSGDYLYALRGNNTLNFYAYSLVNKNWTTFDPTDLPTGANVNEGGRLATDGTYIYALIGRGNSNIYRYTYAAGGGSWAFLTRAPFAPYYGTDLTYNNNKLYAAAGYYKTDFYEYDISANSWRRLSNLSGYGLGANNYASADNLGVYAGSSIEYMGSNSILLSRGNTTADVSSYTIGATKYLSTATYQSSTISLGYVASWPDVSLSSQSSTQGGSTIAYQTRSSTDGVNWHDWKDLSGSKIQSEVPAQYLQVKANFGASGDNNTTSVLSELTISYNPDETAPNNPDPNLTNCQTQQVGGTAMTKGGTYRADHPSCVWDGATDDGSGVAGYYVYFGTSPSANPTESGSYQSTNSFVSNNEMTTGHYYLLVKTKDMAGNVSENAQELFDYNYNGVSPTSINEKNTTEQFSSGTLTGVQAVSNQIKLSSQSDGFWQQERLAIAPATFGFSVTSVYKSSVNKLYVARAGNTTGFYEYNLTTGLWTTLSSTGLGTIYNGGGIVEGPGNYIYAMRGNGSGVFYRYDITADSTGWVDADAEDAPNPFSSGGYLAYDNSRYIYAFRGNGDDSIYKFDPQTTADGQWSTIGSINFGFPDNTVNNVPYQGSSMAFDNNDTMYAIQGNYYSGGFTKFSLTNKTWTPLGFLPFAPSTSASLAWDPVNNQLFYLPGNTNRIFKYSPATQAWTEANTAPVILPVSNSAGLFAQYFNGNLYVFRGGSSAMYRYNIAKDSWFAPTFNLFMPNVFGSASYSNASNPYGGSSTIDENGKIYSTRGSYDSLFISYDPTTGTTTNLPGLPIGAYQGSMLLYAKSNLYFSPAIVNTWFKFNPSTNSWSEITSDPLPAQPGAGAAMIYDGTRYIYYFRGAGTTAWYRYDTDSGTNDGSRWSAALPVTGMTSVNYGAGFVFKNNTIYYLRGQVVNPNILYSFSTSSLPSSGSWSTLANIPETVGYDSFLLDGGNGYLYAPTGQNKTGFYKYDITGNAWTVAPSFPGQVYQGASGVSNKVNKIYTFAGYGTSTYNDGLYSYVIPSADSSFVDSGTYESETIDLSSVYNWANITVNYTKPENTTINIYTQTSSDASAWSSYALVSQEKTFGQNHQFAINSPVNRYVKIKIVLSSGDGVGSIKLSDIKLNYYKDTKEPSNPSALKTAKSQSNNGTDINTATYYNFSNPYFEIPLEGESGGASDGNDGSGVNGYFVYFGDDSQAIPSQTRGIAVSLGGNADLRYQTTNSFTVGTDSSAIAHNKKYYLRIQTKDNAGNYKAGETWTAFEYDFDNQAPTNPSSLTVNPLGFTNIDSYTFTISNNATDSPAGILKYQYRTGNDIDQNENEIWYDFNPLTSLNVTIPNAQHPVGQYDESGTNTFYIRTVDSASNASAPKSIQYYYGSSAPSKPNNLRVDPLSNTTNNFLFQWDIPSAYIGDVNKLTYYYSVNSKPTAHNTNSTSALAVGPGPFATQYENNTFFVVAKDEAGNINYDNYAEIIFKAYTSAPPSPTEINVSDISNKETDEYRLVVSWNAPQISDQTNFGGYDIYESSVASGPFAKIANTSGTAYVQTALVKDSTHYYYVKSTDKTGNESAASTTKSQIATGKFTTAPKIVKDPTVTVGARKAIIKWITSREASSAVEFGVDPNNLDRMDANGATKYVTDHEVEVVKGVQPSTTYYYRVVYTDPDGNVGKSTPTRSFTTSEDPSISSLKVEDATLDSMLITWDSNVPSYGSISYGTTITRLDNEEKEEPYYTRHHVVKVRNLVNGTTYYVQVKAHDEDNNLFTSDVYNEDTLPMPKVSAVKVENKTEVDSPTVIISYTTNVETSTIIRYSASGQNKEYATTDYKKEHSAELSGLLPAVPYSMTISGRDKYGNEAEGQIQSIVTLADSMPPKILTLVDRKRVIGQGDSAEAQLTVKITTNEPTTAKVEVSKGVGNADFSINSSVDSLNTDHTLVVKLDEPGASYSYRVKTYDGAGNLTQTDTKTFVISAANKSAIEYISSIFSRSFSWLGSLMKIK